MTTAAHLFPDAVDLIRAGLAECERLAETMQRQVAEIAKILGVCLRCGLDNRDCRASRRCP